MALKLRRGTDLERQSVIFDEGELIYTTDTKTLWVGDGQTIGGILVGGNVDESPISLTQNLDLNSFDIVGNGDIDITGAVIANSFVGDGSGLTNLFVSFDPGQEYDISIRGNIRGIDSSLIFDYETNSINANLSGDGSNITNISLGQLSDVSIIAPGNGDVLSYVNGQFVNNNLDGLTLNVSILGDDSVLFIDSTNRVVIGNVLGSVSGDVIDPITSDRIIDAETKKGFFNSIESGQIDTVSNNLGDSFVINTLVSDTAGGGQPNTIVINGFGGTFSSPTEPVNFSKTGIDFKFWTGTVYETSGLISSYHQTSGNGYLALNAKSDLTGLFNNGIEINGNGSTNLYADSEVTVNTDLVVTGSTTSNGVVLSGSTLRLANLTTTQRNLLTAANGDMIYNTTANKIQAYQNGSWINLDDGSAA